MASHPPIYRQTVARECQWEGHGIHMAAPARLNIRPAPAGAGIRLHMAGRDWAPLPALAVHADAGASDRRTVLIGPEGQRFEQLEHVMAALAACSITDADLTQEGPEPPFLGGGALEYMDGLVQSGVHVFDQIIEPIVIDRVFQLTDGDAELVVTPGAELRLSCFVEFPGTVVGSQGVSLRMDRETFHGEAAAARTFAKEADLEALQKAGLGRGGSLSNAVVFNASQYLNEELHFPDEVVRHKIVDLLGDLALMGRPLRGHVWAWRAGHRSHVRLAQALLQEFG